MKKCFFSILAFTVGAQVCFAKVSDRKPTASDISYGRWSCSDDEGNHRVTFTSSKKNGITVTSPAGAKVDPRADSNGDATWNVNVTFKNGTSMELICMMPGRD